MTTRRQFFSQKQRKRYYKTVEIYHETIGLLRYVSGRIDPLGFTLEVSAPRNAGETVQFIGSYFEYEQPEQNQGNISLRLQLGRIGKDVKQKLKLVKQSGTQFSPADVIIREYVGDTLTAPAFRLRLFISTITMTSDGAVLLAELDNPAGRPIARRYTAEDFPGLEVSL